MSDDSNSLIKQAEEQFDTDDWEVVDTGTGEVLADNEEDRSGFQAGERHK